MQDQMSSPQTGLAGCLARLVWMFLGNFALAICAVVIATKTETFFSALDVVFWLVAVGMIAARYMDIKHLQGLTAGGQAASMHHWTRYTVRLSGACAAIWATAHAAARYVM